MEHKQEIQKQNNGTQHDWTNVTLKSTDLSDRSN